jgi:hypothetical protein
MDNKILKDELPSLELALDEIMMKGAERLKIAYFKFGILLEERANNIGINSIYFNKDLIHINNRPVKEHTRIRRQDLINVYPKIECETALQIFAEYNTIYKSPFFDRMKNPYDGFVGIIFNDNELRFEHIGFSMEFKIYKANLKKEELESELSNFSAKMEKKIKI